jgi:hypothetical protein
MLWVTRFFVLADSQWPMKYLLLSALAIVLVLYVVGCAFLYFKQEALLFYPQRLPATYQFNFPQEHAEFPITAADGTQLSGLLVKAPAAKGLVFFLHGNGGLLGGLGRRGSHVHAPWLRRVSA